MLKDMTIVFDLRNLSVGQQESLSDAEDHLFDAGLQFKTVTEMDGAVAVTREWIFSDTHIYSPVAFRPKK